MDNIQNFLKALARCLPEERLSTEKSTCWTYGYDNSRRHHPPLAVAFPITEAEIQAIVRCCREHQQPIVAHGRGTATTGATVPVEGGLVLSLERMTNIINIDPANRAIVVQPGVTNQAVQEAAAKHGFFWAPDPTSSAYCSVGGNLALNSGGPRAVKYGTCRENVLQLRAVTGTGESFQTGSYTTKGAVGYDLTRLLIGSEGTLAIITEATLKLTPLPATKRTLRALYKDTRSATQAVAKIMAQSTIPSALELMDHKAIELVRQYAPADLPTDAGALLMIVVDGSETQMDESVQAIHDAAQHEGLVLFDVAETEAQTQSLWQARKNLSPALRHVAPKKINEDVVVPVGQLPALMDHLETLRERHTIQLVTFGHAGNGNLHVNFLIDPDNPQQCEEAQQCLEGLFKTVITLGGTLSGEHGIGIDKQDFVSLALDSVSLQLMRAIKKQFDPDNILNPKKLFPKD